MNTATLTFRDQNGVEFDRFLEEEDLGLFYAKFTGMVKGGLGFGTVLVNVERDAWS